MQCLDKYNGRVPQNAEALSKIRFRSDTSRVWKGETVKSLRCQSIVSHRLSKNL